MNRNDQLASIEGELKQLCLPGFQVPYKTARPILVSERERSSALTDLHSPQRLAEAFKDGDVISSILPKYIKGNIPSFNIVGAAIESPEDFAKLTWTLRSPYMEVLKVAFLNEQGKAVHSATLSVGAINQTLIHPLMILREVQRIAGKTNTNRIIISHNHPSGDPTPSHDDIRATRELVNAMKISGIELADHVITNGRKFSSWKQAWAISSLETPQPDWEMVAKPDLTKIEDPAALEKIVASLRQADPGHDHVIYGDVKLQVTAVERLSAALPLEDLSLKIARGSGREGALNVWFETALRETKDVVHLNESLGKVHINLLDAGTSSIRSLRAAGLFMETNLGMMKTECQTSSEVSQTVLNSKAIDTVKSVCRGAMSLKQNIEYER